MARTNATDPTLNFGGSVQWTRCPQCGAIAEVRFRDVLSSTNGPVEHVGVLCAARHTLLLPADALNAPPAASA